MPATDPPLPSAGVRDHLRYLDQFERTLEPLDRSIMLAEWDLYSGRSTAGAGKLEVDRARLLNDPRVERWTRRLDPSGWPDVAARRLELLRREVVEAQTEQHPTVIRLRQRLQRRVVAFRPRWEGKRVGRSALYDVLRKDPEPGHRRRAFYAEHPFLRSIAPALRELVLERNDRARGLGYRSYADLRLGFEGLSVERLQALADEVVRSGAGPIHRFRDRFLERQGRAEWYPWDFGFAGHELSALPDRAFPAASMVRDVRVALEAWGIPRSRLRFRVARHDLPFGGLTIVPHVPDDVRVLVNPRRGWEYYSVLFHEFGHAVHAASTRAPSHLLRNGAGFTALHEGVADVFEEVAAAPEWLATRQGLAPEEVERFLQSRRDRALMRTVGMALATTLELGVYEAPYRDPVPGHHRRVRRVLGFGEYTAGPWPDPLMVTHPVYVQNYFLSQLFRKQVLARARSEVGGSLWPNQRLGPWIAEKWLAPGARYDWMPRLREVTGRPLGSEAFLRFVRGREP